MFGVIIFIFRLEFNAADERLVFLLFLLFDKNLMIIRGLYILSILIIANAYQALNCSSSGNQAMPSDYTIYYWPISFRAEFIKLIFVHKKVKYDLASVQEVVAVKNQPIELSGNGPNMFAPPMVSKNNRNRNIL